MQLPEGAGTSLAVSEKQSVGSSHDMGFAHDGHFFRPNLRVNSKAARTIVRNGSILSCRESISVDGQELKWRRSWETRAKRSTFLGTD